MAIALVLAVQFLATVLVHAVLNRLCRVKLAPQGAAMAAVAIAIGLVFLVDRATLPLPARPGRLAYLLLLTLSFGYNYFHFFNMTETSRRGRLLNMIAAGQALDPETAQQKGYDAREILQVRLTRLLELGQIRKEGDRYRLQGRMFYMASLAVGAMRGLLGFQR